ncbi:MAG: hypothetical protein IT435_01990 [Phycisphaerales bacterium]|nr:hypothetical protein [Phycisphaerales bacterium]
MEPAIYDNVPILHDGTPGVIGITTGLPADFFFVGGTADAGDWITARMPRAGDAPAGGVFTQFIESLLFGISYTGPGVGPDVPVDSYHLWFDDLVTWDFPGALPDITRGSFLGGFFLPFLPAADITTCGCFYAYTVAGISGAGIFIPIDDNYIVYEHFIGVAGAPVPILDPAGLNVFNGDGSPAGIDGINNIGYSDDLFLFDADASGLYNDPEWLFFFGGTPFTSNLYLSMTVLFCDSDFDGTGFSDLDDFSDFVVAFEAGC